MCKYVLCPLPYYVSQRQGMGLQILHSIDLLPLFALLAIVANKAYLRFVSLSLAYLLTTYTLPYKSMLCKILGVRHGMLAHLCVARFVSLATPYKSLICNPCHPKGMARDGLCLHARRANSYKSSICMAWEARMVFTCHAKGNPYGVWQVKDL